MQDMMGGAVLKKKTIWPKLPSRRDSKEVVESIVEAATEILAKEGMAELTTNRIAERAGVGVASVYRYFKDKIAIVAEIDLRNRKYNAARITTALQTGLDGFKASEAPIAPSSTEEGERRLATILRLILQGFLDTKDERSRIRRTLMTEVPLSWIAAPAMESWNEVTNAAAMALVAIRPDITMSEAQRRVFFILHAIQGIVVGQLVFPQQSEMGQAEAIEYVERLVMPFLLAPT